MQHIKQKAGGGSGGGYYGGTAHTSAGQQGGRGGSGYVGNLIEGKSISGSEEMPSHDGTSSITGNAGGGYAKITFVGYQIGI